MANYAIGAIIIADLRARAKAVHGDFALGDTTWYPWVSERLYRFGLQRPSRQVIEDFLGRPLSPDALLADLGRMSGR
jgi:Zn-dependent M32 family carboxypeptidase